MDIKSILLNLFICILLITGTAIFIVQFAEKITAHLPSL